MVGERYSDRACELMSKDDKGRHQEQSLRHLPRACWGHRLYPLGSKDRFLQR
jgi:hypothetical protein